MLEDNLGEYSQIFNTNSVRLESITAQKDLPGDVILRFLSC